MNIRGLKRLLWVAITKRKSPGFPGLLFDDRDRPAAYSAVFQQVIGVALRPKVLLERFS